MGKKLLEYCVYIYILYIYILYIYIVYIYIQYNIYIIFISLYILYVYIYSISYLCIYTYITYDLVGCFSFRSVLFLPLRRAPFTAAEWAERQEYRWVASVPLASLMVCNETWISSDND